MTKRTKPNLMLDHVAIPINDPEATLKFYSEVLGLSLVDVHNGDDWGGMPWLMMIFAAGDERQIALVAFDGGRAGKSSLPSDARHYAFSLTTKAELKAWKAKLRGAGIQFSEEDHGRQQSIYFEDPNGIVLEITAPASSSKARANASAVSAVTAWVRRRTSASTRRVSA